MIHPTAIVEDGVKLGADVEVGPFSVIHAGAEIDSGSKIGSHVVIHGCVKAGKDNVFHSSCAIGDLPQDVSISQCDTRVEIGNSNVFREFVTVHRGTEKDRAVTTIGSNNYLMNYSHVAHDCAVGNHVVMTNLVSLGGHSRVDDHVILAGHSAVHQHCHLGRFSFIGASTIVNKDVVPFAMVVPRDTARSTIRGYNAVGLRRNGFDRQQLTSIKSAFKILFDSNLNTAQAVEQLEVEFPDNADVKEIVNFIKSSKRGIAK